MYLQVYEYHDIGIQDTGIARYKYRKVRVPKGISVSMMSMLTDLTIQHFLLIDQLSLDFESGMSAFTGETGAGKSILCDALYVGLGGRADTTVIQQAQENCYIQVKFNIQLLPHVQNWLVQYGLNSDWQYCQLERNIPRTGRAQALINGKVVPLQRLKALGELLLVIHGQHGQQDLLKREYQCHWLDHYGDCLSLLESIREQYAHYHQLQAQHRTLSLEVSRLKAEEERLQYQQAELKALAFHSEELTELEPLQRRLSNAQHILESGHTALALIEEAEPAHLNSLLYQVQQILHKITLLDVRFQNAETAIEQAVIQVSEAQAVIQKALSQTLQDPQQLQQVENRLSQIQAIARKYSVQVNELTVLERKVMKECEEATQVERQLQYCEQQLAQCLSNYHELAQTLSKRRQKSANRLQRLVTEKIQWLGMKGGQFEIRMIPTHSQFPTRFGQEHIEFYLSAAPGQSLQALTQCASGGELSRVHLALQALTAETMPVPTLIFDEVDVGMGGSTAEMAGRLLQQIGERRQIICITHLPQVAALSQHHYQIQKLTQQQATQTQVCRLDTQALRVQEIARMLGGIQITSQTIAHAEEMLAASSR